MGNGVTFGNYVLQTRIASGGMAEVFEAVQQNALLGVERQVAIKRILPHLLDDPRFVTMFQDEARLAAQLSHPNLVHVYEFGQYQDHFFIAMELVRGVDARALCFLAREERLPPVLAARVIADTCRGLEYAHSKTDASGKPLELVHRDVSPSNILVSFEGNVKLVDFGIAKATTSVGRTRSGIVKGKCAFMSPEQTLGLQLTAKSDVYSVGLVLWELLAGRDAVPHGAPVEAMKRLRDNDIEFVRDVRSTVPSELAAVLHSMLVLEPDGRPTAGTVARALESFIRSQEELADETALGKLVREEFATSRRSASEGVLGPTGTASTDEGKEPSATGTVRLEAEAGEDEPHTYTEIATASGNSTLEDGPAPMGMASIPGQTLESPQDGTGHSFDTAAHTLEDDPETVTAIDHPSAQGIPRMGVATSLFGRSSSQPSPSLPAKAWLWFALAMLVAVPLGMEFGRRLASHNNAPTEPSKGVHTQTNAWATLEVRTEPSGAVVLVDGTYWGTSPITIAQLPARTVLIELLHPGAAPWRNPVELTPSVHQLKEIKLREGATDAALIPESPSTFSSGYLFLESEPGASISFDGRLLGSTPLWNVAMPVGTHRLRLESQDAHVYERLVVIRPGKVTRERFVLGVD